MNATRTITLTFGYSEIVDALKAAYPGAIHVQGLPQVGGSGVTVETTARNGLTLKFTTQVASEEPVRAKPLLLQGSGV